MAAQGWSPAAEEPFVWSCDLDGALTDRLSGRKHRDWQAAGAALSYYLLNIPRSDGNIIAHSHGGDALTHHPEPALGEILGLAYRVNLNNTDWEIKINPRRPDIKELDSLPFPAWDLVDVPRYQEIWRGKHGYYSMNMVTTRGCPYHCSWCAKPIWGQRYNVRSPENVVRELKWLVNNYKPDHIWFADDIFGLRPGWLQEYARLLEKENLHVPFKCLSRVDLLLRSGEIEAFKRSGAQTIWVGADQDYNASRNDQVKPQLKT